MNRANPSTRWSIALLTGAFVLSAGGLSAQTEPEVEDPLLGRWVGTHLGRPLFLDFYSDTMLVVGIANVARYALGFWHTRDSLVAYGDTAFALRYEFRAGYLLILNSEGNWVTMSPQDLTARPLHGRWLADAEEGQQILLVLRRGGPARWRYVPGGSWIAGEWTRQARSLTFEWLPDSASGLPDSTKWEGFYDNPKALIVQDSTLSGGMAIFHRFIR